jgi:hypothetical protein
MNRLSTVAIAMLLWPALSWGQESKKKPVVPAVDPKTDAAIKKGVAFLKGQVNDLGKVTANRQHELVLWTFQHAGVPETEPEYQKLLKMLLETELERTYTVSLQAMILEDLDRVKNQTRIWQCAQFLVDNQCKRGDWSYGDPSPFTSDVATAFKDVKAVPTDAKASAKKLPRVKVPVAKHRDAKAPYGDCSNSQYAALGLRACHDAGILIPPEVIDAAIKRWRDARQADPSPLKGWNYRGNDDQTQKAYGSMTAGGLGALAIYQYIQNKPWMQDKDCLGARDWLAQHYSISENPGKVDGEYAYYFLYALERAGVFFGFDKLDGHDWYSEGSSFLLKAQKADGSWHSVEDTCFAILFLRRATRPLVDVASVDRFINR